MESENSLEEDKKEGLPPPLEEEKEPKEGLEMFICYGRDIPTLY